MPPDRAHIVVSDEQHGNTEDIEIAGVAYSRREDGPWVLSDAGGDPTAVQQGEYIIRELQKGGRSAQAPGNEAAGDTPADTYQVIATVDMAGTIVPLRLKVWVGGAGRLVRMDTCLPDTQQVASVEIYEYDPTITIEAPSP